MPSITREFVIDAPRERVFRALSTAEGVRGWWTADADLGPAWGEFRWADRGWAVAVEVHLCSEAIVVWRCARSNMQGTDAWEGSTIAFHLSQRRDGKTALSFSQKGYKDSPCLGVCDDGWSKVLGLSLRAYCETGAGMPYRSSLEPA